MANYTTDFNLANGTTLPVGLTAVNGTFEITSGRLEATGTNPGGPSWLAGLVASSANHYSECTVNARGSITSAFGPYVRRSDNDNLWVATLDSDTGLVSLFERNAGAFTNRGSYQIEPYDFTNNDIIYRVGLLAYGNELEVYIDGIRRISFTSTHNNTATGAGVRFGDTTHAAYSLTVLTDAIILDTQQLESRQRTGATTTCPVAGRYLGTVTNLEYAVDGGSYTTGVASPTGNTFTFNASLSDGHHSIDLRFSNNTSITATIEKYTVGMGVAIFGQSNGAGRALTNQRCSPNRAGVEPILLGTDDRFKQARDPISATSEQVDAVLDDNNPKGSWFLLFCNYVQDVFNVPIIMIPCCQGGTNIAQFLSTSVDTVNGLNRYDSITRRIDLIGGCEYVISDIGESDAEDLTVNTAFSTDLETVFDDLNTAYGCLGYIRRLHTLYIQRYDGNGTTTGQNAIRAAQVSLAGSNANISIGPDVSDIDIGATDKIHFQTDEQIEIVARRYADDFISTFLNNSVTLTATGIPDGTYRTRLYSSLRGNLIFDGDVTFTSDTATISAPFESSDVAFGTVDDGAGTPTNGAFLVSTVA